MSHLTTWLRTRRFSEPTFRPSRATNHWKNIVNRDFFSLLLFSSLTLPTSAFPSVHIVGSLTSKLPSMMFLLPKLHDRMSVANLLVLAHAPKPCSLGWLSVHTPLADYLPGIAVFAHCLATKTGASVPEHMVPMRRTYGTGRRKGRMLNYVEFISFCSIQSLRVLFSEKTRIFIAYLFPANNAATEKHQKTDLDKRVQWQKYRQELQCRNHLTYSQVHSCFWSKGFGKCSSHMFDVAFCSAFSFSSLRQDMGHCWRDPWQLTHATPKYTKVYAEANIRKHIQKLCKNIRKASDTLRLLWSLCHLCFRTCSASSAAMIAERWIFAPPIPGASPA